MLFCHITSQVEGDKDQNLLADKGGRGFPYLVYMDAGGTVIARQGSRSVEGLEATGRLVKQYVELKKQADSGDQAAALEVAILGAELGQFQAEEGRSKLAELKDVTPDQKKRIDRVLVNYDVQAMIPNLRDKAAVVEAGKKFADWKGQGKVPTGDNEVGTFHSCILEYAEQEKNVTLFEESLNAIKAHFGKNLNARFLEAKAKILEQLKAERK